MVAGLAGAATIAAIPAALGGAADPSERGRPEDPVPGRLPVVFLPHGGGPWPFVDVGMRPAEHAELAGYLRSIRELPKAPPRALLVISAHWEEPVPTVMTAERPPMYYDYHGFPRESYTIQWPAPGAPELAARVRELLGAAGFPTAADPKRGFDHGTFVPLMLTYPDADVKTIQLSLKLGLDPSTHLAMGRALAPLRDEGVFIVGSGMTYHNMRGFRDPNARPIAETFDAWLRETMTLEAKARDERLIAWANAPAARLSHPREEHLLPLMVVAGAAGADRGTTAYNGSAWGIRLSAYHFG
ncbi:dioxygenase [Polyangium spumosum]|uniref:Dioxygenase n=2 Tax=Polyangium spumosum TaxID=889282 RepID=A0A6N7Q086_9BACT|nr:dioxygenase [Polyangium spumosum]